MEEELRRCYGKKIRYPSQTGPEDCRTPRDRILESGGLRGTGALVECRCTLHIGWCVDGGVCWLACDRVRVCNWLYRSAPFLLEREATPKQSLRRQVLITNVDAEPYEGSKRR